MSKADLLKELEELGIDPKSGRKKRSDRGKPRPTYSRSSTVRADFGSVRKNYKKSAKVYKRIFQQFINLHLSESNGDDIMRDANLIIPPNITNYYKKVTRADGTSYRSSQKRNTHPEQMRWDWWFAELQSYAEDTPEYAQWAKRICDWYFIKQDDLELWSYSEWSWAYVSEIAGHENRLITGRTILSYLKFIEGKYGRIEYDDKGDIVWNRKGGEQNG